MVEAQWLAAGVAYSRKFHAARDAPTTLTIGGVPCADVICWPYLRGEECSCGGTRAHVFRNGCGRAVNSALSAQAAPCRHGATCKRGVHPTADDVRRELSAWWRATHGGEPEFAHAAVAAAAPPPDASRSTTSAAGASASRRCTLPAARLLELLSIHASDSPHIEKFLAEPCFAAMVGDDRVRRLFEMRSRVKEMGEAYSVLQQLRALVAEGTAAGTCGADGEGLTIIDACSGRGMGPTLLSYALPSARVLMIDANANMELSHVAARPNLAFLRADLYAASTVAAIAAEARAARACVVTGMHLCGALSPKLIDIAVAVEDVDALVLCPCCLKGAHGAAVARAAEERGTDAYDTLMETLQAICEREVAGVPGVSLRVVRDEHMISPRNCFLLMRRPPRPAGAEVAAFARCEPCEPPESSLALS